MKKVFVILMLLTVGMLSVQAQIQNRVKSPNSGSSAAQEYRRLHLGLDIGSTVVGGNSFMHVEGELGYYLNSKNMLMLELGGGSYTDQLIGYFHYTVGSTTYNDGRIYYSYQAFTPTLSWSYFLNEPTKKWRWRVGPSIGLLKMTGKDSYKWDQSVNINNLPARQSASTSAGLFAVHVGLQWNFASRWFANFEYRIGAHTGISFDEREIRIGNDRSIIDEKSFDALTHKITVGVGWRFGATY